MKKILITLLISGLIFSSVGFLVGMIYTNKNKDLVYDKPEDLVIDFFETMQEGDTKKALAMYGIQKKSKSYNIEAFIKRINAINIQTLREIPSSTKMFEPMSEISMQSTPVLQLSNFIISLNLSDNEIYNGQSLLLEDNKKVLDELLEVYELENLEEMQLKEVYLYELDSDRAEENYEKMAEIYDCETKMDLLAVFEYDRDDYCIAMTLMNSEEGYFIDSLNSAILGTSYLGIPDLYDYWEDKIDEKGGIGEFELIWEE